jgi:hypothetical protein
MSDDQRPDDLERADATAIPGNGDGGDDERTEATALAGSGDGGDGRQAAPVPERDDVTVVPWDMPEDTARLEPPPQAVPAVAGGDVLDTGRMSAAEQAAVIDAARGRAAALWRSQESRPRRQRSAGPWVISSVALVVAVASLALNGLLLRELSSRRDAVQSLMSDASAGLDSAAADGLSFEFPVKQTIHFVGDIPVQQDFDFPVDTTIAFNATVRVPVDLGALGTIYVSVPINTSVPVKTTVPVHVDQTIHVDTEIPIEMTVPITLSPDQPPLKDALDQARRFLARLQGLL